MPKKILAQRPGQLLVAESTVDLSQVNAPGWIVNTQRKTAASVPVHSAMRQGYWKDPAKGAAIPAGVTFPAPKSPPRGK